MNRVKSKSGETELQTPEHVPDGPVVLATTAPDSRKMINRSDGTPSAKPSERPVYVPTPTCHPADQIIYDLRDRIVVLEQQVKSLQMSMPKGIAKAKP